MNAVPPFIVCLQMEDSTDPKGHLGIAYSCCSGFPFLLKTSSIFKNHRTSYGVYFLLET